MIKYSKRKCPICEALQSEVLYTQHFILPDNMFLPAFYDIVSCLKCGFVYADTYASQKDYDLFYTEMSKYENPEIASGGNNTFWDKNRLLRVASDLNKYINKQSAILDIGCANGGLLAILGEQGFVNLIGLDPSHSCVSYIKNNYGIRAIQGGIFDDDFSDITFMGENFDMIILSHVLEHIYDLRLALNLIVSKLKDKAYLYIETPDAANYYKYQNVPFYYFDSEHINHFDLKHLVMLFEANGFSVEWYTQKEFFVSEKTLYPAVALVLRYDKNKFNNIDAKHECSAKMSVSKHIEQSIIGQSYNKIDILAEQYEEVIVWGAGQYTYRLLENSRLGDCNIIAFIDNDKSKQGMTIKGVNVYSPEYLKENRCTVLVCAALHTCEIVRQIKDMGIKRKILSPTEIYC